MAGFTAKREIAEELHATLIHPDTRLEPLALDDEQRVVLFAALEDATTNIAWHASARGVLLPIMRKLEAQE